jgi:tetratricopeptide (TPR) repeat protein
VESLQILRRGLQRAELFALFIAVSNSPATSREMIRLIQESMPSAHFETVELGENVENPLDSIVERLSRETEGSLMILGLERSNPSSLPDHPVLFALNLSRPEWPRRLPVPVVLWVPEYLLGLLEREAPDFMDWRSDTVFFPEPAAEDLVPLDARLWGGGGDRSMPEHQRRSRMEELHSRLAGQAESEDPIVLAARASWLSELGEHALLLGELVDAERYFREAFASGERLDRPGLIAPLYNSLGAVLEAQGRMEEAERLVRNGLAIEQSLGNEEGMAVDYGNLAVLLTHKSHFAEAREMFLRASEIHSRLGDTQGVARNSLNLASLELELGNLADAEEGLRRGLAMYDQIGHHQGMALAYGNLAVLLIDQGDLREAEELLREATKLSLQLGDLAGAASLHLRFGLVHARRGETAQAQEAWMRARDLYSEMGMTRQVKTVDAWLAGQNQAPK